MSLKERFGEYFLNLYNDVPEWVYCVLLCVFCIGALIAFLFCGIKRGWRIASKLLLAEYVLVIFSATVFFREGMDAHKLNLMPFWSYFYYFEEGKLNIIVGNVLNIIVFIPVGLLLGMSFEKMKFWTVVIIGMVISLAVEVLQLIAHRGMAELDDVMHNTIGCILGYGLYLIIRAIVFRLFMNHNMINREL